MKTEFEDETDTGDREKNDVPPPTPNTIVGLLRELRDEMQTLLHQELDLLKAEMSEKVGRAQSHLNCIIAGSILLGIAAVFALWTLNFALTALYVEVGVSLDVAVWLSPLTLSVLTSIIGWIVLKKGRSGLSEMSATPRKTIKSLREDGRWTKEKISN